MSQLVDQKASEEGLGVVQFLHIGLVRKTDEELCIVRLSSNRAHIRLDGKLA
jgi:hypothetical protein